MKRATIIIASILVILGAGGLFYTKQFSQNSESTPQKATYNRLPLFWRALGYFSYRYFIKLGFLDGKEGFLWDFLQGWWYRTLVDAKIYEIKKTCGNNPDKIKNLLRNEYGIKI